MTLDTWAVACTGLAVMAGVYSGGRTFSEWFFEYEKGYVERAEADLYGMFSSMSPKQILQWSFICFGLAFLISAILFARFETATSTLVSLIVCALIGLAASTAPKWILKRAAVLRIRKFDLQLLDALLSMSNALKAGFSIIQAFESIVQEGKNPIAQEFDLFLREIRLGVKFDTACDNLNKRVPSEDLKIVLVGIETARQTGGNLTEVFDRLSVVIRERMRIQGRIQSLTAQGRMQGWVVGLMPLVLGFAYYMIQPSMMISFVSSTAGIFLILLMLMLQVVGFLLIRKIVTIDV